MTGGRWLAAALVAGLAWGSSACSLLLTDQAPSRARWASAERVRCSGFEWAATDIVAAGVIPLASVVELTDERRDPTTVALVAAAGAAVFLLSATWGVHAAETCGDYDQFRKARALAAAGRNTSDAGGRGDAPCQPNGDCIPRLVCSTPGPLCPSARKPGPLSDPRPR